MFLVSIYFLKVLANYGRVDKRKKNLKPVILSAFKMRGKVKTPVELIYMYSTVRAD